MTSTKMHRDVSEMDVLVAIERPEVRRNVLKQLKDWRGEIHTVSCGEEAWYHLCNPTASQIAILDWNLPEIKGDEICSRLQGNGNCLPYTILTSAESQICNRQVALDMGAHNFIGKPICETAFSSALDKAFRYINIQTGRTTEISESESDFIQTFYATNRKERREATRSNVTMKMRFLMRNLDGILMPDINHESMASTDNVSNTGMSFVSDEILSMGESFLFSFPTATKLPTGEAVIVHYERAPKGYRYGCSFVEFHKRDKSA